ncbi:MAG: lipid-A-disaccharide synthase N-terminal domain-containing protein [Flavobacteriaceae bacterium]|nr:lipid-A-disaccharide synthase N-terminal domain-containing protein [Flavobacteriaceae bacterium]
MIDIPIEIIILGFIAQFFFSTRVIIQWFYTEREAKVITPTIYWILSLSASLLFFMYGYFRDDFAIMFGQFIGYYIYIRNLQIQKKWINFNLIIRQILLLLPIIICIERAWNSNFFNLESLFYNPDIPQWLLYLGIISQITFTFRYVYQWMSSEILKKSHLPLGFWIISILGAVLIITYSIFRLDPVLFISHVAGIFMYSRNIYFIYINRNIKASD